MSVPEINHILQTGLGFWASKTLLSAIEMEVFTELARHPEDPTRWQDVSAFIRDPHVISWTLW